MQKGQVMSISDRYREITREVQAFVTGLGAAAEGESGRRLRTARIRARAPGERS